MARWLVAGAALSMAAVGAWTTGPGQTAPSVQVTVDVGAPGAAIPATLFGVFFEDINFAADGGLYPERVKNRSFEFPDPLTGWTRSERGGAKGSLLVIERGDSATANRHYLRITADTPGTGFGATNEGFRGIGVRRGEAYSLSVRARRVTDGPASMRAVLETPGRQSLVATEIGPLTTEWRDHTVTVTPAATEPRGTLTLLVQQPGAIEIDSVSLFPRDTWKGRPNGLRTDLAEMLASLRPGFLRFPGGCIVEGRHLETRYQWKSTIGPVHERRLVVNRWNDEVRQRPAPDYFQSFGLGFYEYFVLSEDLGAEPLPIINCGMACQFNSSELVSMDALDEYVQDALDLIEFANGPATSAWGRRRAEMGHPAPFNLRMIGVGNEQWGPQYVERFARFATVLRARHPEIALVGGSGPDPDGPRFEFLWQKMRELGADFVDEHYYRPPEWFLTQANRYDGYPRSGPKVFAGEFAAHTTGPGRERRNSLEAAVAEAAVMTGIERNADIVQMAAYAPLFGHVDAWQWRPNLIWFDNLRAFATPSYHVQQMFATSRGTHVLPVQVQDGQNGATAVVASASLDRGSGEVIVKLVNPSAEPRDMAIALAGGVKPASAASLSVLSGDPDAENTIDEPAVVAPQSRTITTAAARIRYGLPAHAVAIIRVR